MEKEQFDEIRDFTRSLNAKRLLMPDGQLLDLCQQHLDALLLHIEDEFEEHPHINEEAAAPEPSHSGQGPKLASNIYEPPPFTAPPAAAEPEVHHPHIVVHKAPHKRPTPRKTHR